ncbi:HAD hydrolase family protein [Aeribacillus pallidus]|uniref:HAD hydrolase family protein n=1 Tax=Aeribacillus TaxID=1055323 RepID=UPI003B5B72AF
MAIDLDGTILTNDHMISERNREAIVNAQTKTKPLYPFKGRRGFLFFSPLFSFPHVQSLLARLF